MIPEMLEKILADLREEVWMQALLQRGEVFVVGGTVRDAYRDEPIKDIDMIVEGPNMDEIKVILSFFGEVGIYGESFAVIKFKPTGYEGDPYDIAVPRVDTKVGEGHLGFEVHTEGVCLEDDLNRRDFTINSIAVNVATNDLIDPFDGLYDIGRGVIKATDENVFAEDPLRILRGIQFAARFGYTIEDDTMILMQNHAEEIMDISGERIFGELTKIIDKDGDTQLAFDLLVETDVDVALFGKKMQHYKPGLEHLDPISFFYVLGLLGEVCPFEFLRKRLKGDNLLVKNVRILDNIFTFITLLPDEEELKFHLFKVFNIAPDVMEAVILPEEVAEVVLNMRLQAIPMNWDDIKADGDLIKQIGNLDEGPEIGKFKDQMLRDALMNRFKWKQRGHCIEYIKKLIYS